MEIFFLLKTFFSVVVFKLFLGGAQLRSAFSVNRFKNNKLPIFSPEIVLMSKVTFFKIAEKSPDALATFGRRIAPKTFQK